MAPKKKGKEVKTIFTVQIPAGKATPAPPLGPILGQNGVVIPEFCNEFNEKTRDLGDDVLPVVVTVFGDNSFKMKIKKPTVSSMLKKASGIEKGSANPKTEKSGSVTKSQVKEIAERKLPDLNTRDIEAAMKIVEGTANSMGLEIAA